MTMKGLRNKSITHTLIIQENQTMLRNSLYKIVMERTYLPKGFEGATRRKEVCLSVMILLTGLFSCACVQAAPRAYSVYSWGAEEVRLYYVPRGESVPKFDSDSASKESVLQAVEVGAESSVEQIAFDAINAFRAQNGLPALQYSAGLSSESRGWSSTMKRSGFRHGSGNENIAMNNLRGAESARRVVEQWKNSSGHRAFLLSRSITTAGIGYDDGYWTFRGR
jgi:hypothetical protein